MKWNQNQIGVDTWCGEAPLCESFPTLYDLAGSKGIKTAEVQVTQGTCGAWNPNFIRPFSYLELETVQSFKDVISRESISLSCLTNFYGKAIFLVAIQSRRASVCWKLILVCHPRLKCYGTSLYPQKLAFLHERLGGARS